MSLNIRRVVTGHDSQGRAKVLIDETVKNVGSQRPGALYGVIWSSEGFPVDNDGDEDPSGKKIGTTIPNGTVFRIVSFGPGVAPRNHRTDSIDYAVVMSGEIDMELDGTQRSSQGRRRAGPARYNPQLDQQGHGTLRDRLYARFGKAGDGRWKKARRTGLNLPAPAQPSNSG